MKLKSISAIDRSLEQCLDAGLLKQSGSKYSFVHDQIQTASFGTIPQKDLPSMQLVIGRGLLNHRLPSGTGQEADVLFLAVDLCNSGSSGLDDTGKIELASPNLKAAEKAIHALAFDAAITYGKAGLMCLKQVFIEDSETKVLKLKLHTALAEASFCIGDGPATEEYMQERSLTH
jgi:predicted ATPase